MLVFVAVLLAVAGCGGPSTSSSTGSDSGDTSSDRPPSSVPSAKWSAPPTTQAPSPVPPSSSFVLTAPAQCPRGWIGLWITTRAPAAKPFLGEVAACGLGSGQVIWLHNAGAQAWRLTVGDQPARSYARFSPRQSRQIVFSSTLPDSPANWLLPGDTVRIDVPPRTVHWYLDAGQSSSWSTFQGLAELAEDSGDPLLDEFKRTTPRGNALVTCAGTVISSYDIYAKGSQQPNYSLVQAVSDGLDVGKYGRNCAQAWDKAERYHRTSVPANRLSSVVAEKPQLTRVLESLEPWVETALKAAATRGRG